MRTTPHMVLHSLALGGLIAVTVASATGASEHGSAAAPRPTARPAGLTLAPTWQGTLDAGAAKLRLALHLAAKPDGGWAATIDSLDQGANGIPVDRVTLDGARLDLELKALTARYSGALNAAGTEISGTWSQGGASLPLIFTAVETIVAVRRPQVPSRPFPYREEEVIVLNEEAGVRLAGTLTLPPGRAPFPAVVLISGSGSQDRDETILGHKPFLVIADDLTRRGIAVLRLDDRGVGGSSRGADGATIEDFAGDALAAVAYLKARSEIHPAHIGLLGHSEGGIIAPLAATRSADVAFVVMLAGSGVPGEAIVLSQSELLLKAQGAPAAAIARARATTEKVFAVVKQERDQAAAEARIRAIIAAEAPEMPAATLDAQVAAVTSPWFRFFLTYDPRPALAKVKVPVLALWGERDLQVPPVENSEAVRGALLGGGNPDATIRILPGLNHLFQECTTGAVGEYSTIEQTVSPSALAAIGSWIVDHSGGTAPGAAVK